MPHHYTEDQLRKRLLTVVSRQRTRALAAEEMGVSASFLSQVLGGAPLTGKIVDFLGFRKIKRRTFERKVSQERKGNGYGLDR